MRRRDALILGAIVAVAVAIPPVLRRLPRDFAFEPLAGEPGFRRLVTGESAAVFAPFVGLEPGKQDPTPRHSGDLCKALFGEEAGAPETVAIATFTDVNCPYCKTHDDLLRSLRDQGAPIRLVWHDLPLRGASSVRAARAMLAARLLGAEEAARVHLSRRVLRPGPSALGEMASEIGVDANAFVSLTGGAEVDRLLAEGTALAQRLGLPGTPGTVVGRTVVVGAIKKSELTKLIEEERVDLLSGCV